MSPVTRRRLVYGAPLLGAVVATGAALDILARMNGGRFDPHDVGTPALDRTVPTFALPAQSPGRGFTSADLRTNTGSVLVNFFASWCVPCVAETPALADLAGQLPIWGVSYKDAPTAAAGFVARTGNVYTRIGADPAGTVAVDWGVTGVPENFLVDRHGIIRGHWAGPLTRAAMAAIVASLPAA